MRKQELKEKAEAERKEFMDKAGYFHLFNKLPIDLRLKIWEMAMLEPTHVKVSVSKYAAAPYNPNSRCGTRGPASISEYRATATVPALLLVSHEAHAAAKKFYKVLFRNTAGCYGVLAQFPTVLKLDEGRLLSSLLQNNRDDLAFVETFVFTASGSWKFSRNETLFTEIMLEMAYLDLLEIRIANEGVQRFLQPNSSTHWTKSLLNLIKNEFAQRQEADPEWSAPRIRIVDLGSGGTSEVELYRYEGGRVTTMGDVLATEVRSA